MVELIEANWLLILIALVIGIIVAWWIFAASRKASVTYEKPDPEDSDTPKRNQALIDSPPAAGPLSSAANTREVAAAPVVADAEAGAQPVPEDELVETPKDESRPGSAPASEGDDLTQIKGLGPKLANILHEHGVTSYAQIASWTPADIERIDAQLGRFQGRIERDNWVEQAALLGAGDRAAYEAKFGRA